MHILIEFAFNFWRKSNKREVMCSTNWKKYMFMGRYNVAHSCFVPYAKEIVLNFRIVNQKLQKISCHQFIYLQDPDPMLHKHENIYIIFMRYIQLLINTPLNWHKFILHWNGSWFLARVSVKALPGTTLLF